ncbi:hypothetical protein [Sporosarcina sp. Te-1]|uniref:hypothetical protein n=1 Tax=Sporosarcina sp. Te-1 TaxID=2818390 RepID=UPI001A9FFA06|nr:hypothetical protein [Sporosarcina sp. Te-1]QTD40368.1 hypothetical protein J3U78_16520 [Sporosarcina sp. Te-1]
MKKKMALAALGLGAAYLMRNKEAREKLSSQFDSFGSTPMRGGKSNTTASSQNSGRRKGLLGNLLS